MDAERTRTWYIAALALIGVASAVRLWLTIRSGDTTSTTITIAVLIVLGIVVGALAWIVRSVGRCARNAAAHRPGTLVVPGYTTAEMPGLASVVGASRKGWWAAGGSPLAIVAVPGAFEVWGPRDEAPRWTVPAMPAGVTIAPALYGSRRTDSVWLSDGTTAAVFMPAYHPLRAAGGLVGDDVRRAVTELTGAAGTVHAG